MLLTEFARTVFGGEEHLLSLVRRTHSMPVSLASSEVFNYVQAAATVLSEATKVNPDGLTVAKWFNHERLPDFEFRTPAEVNAQGKSDALIAYIQSLDAGWAG